MKTITTKCRIVGGGPAGIFLGYLLARSGVDMIGFLLIGMLITRGRPSGRRHQSCHPRRRRGGEFAGGTAPGRHVERRGPRPGPAPPRTGGTQDTTIAGIDPRQSVGSSNQSGTTDLGASYVRRVLPPLAPLLRRIAGRWIGIGFQPEHTKTPLEIRKA